MGQYGPYVNGQPITETYGIRPGALQVGARTLGTEQAVPGFIREMGPEAIVWWEEARAIYESQLGAVPVDA